MVSAHTEVNRCAQTYSEIHKVRNHLLNIPAA